MPQPRSGRSRLCWRAPPSKSRPRRIWPRLPRRSSSGAPSYLANRLTPAGSRAHAGRNCKSKSRSISGLVFINMHRRAHTYARPRSTTHRPKKDDRHRHEMQFKCTWRSCGLGRTIVLCHKIQRVFSGLTASPAPPKRGRTAATWLPSKAAPCCICTAATEQS